MNKIDQLTQLFARFPGIGPRQSKRLVYFLLTQPKSFHNELAFHLQRLDSESVRCSQCFRYFSADNKSITRCSICRDESRNAETLMVVEKDVDLDNVERSGIFDGKYFVLGGTIQVLEKEPEARIRLRELVQYVEAQNFTEIVVGLSANPDGDNTVEYILNSLKDLATKNNIKLTKLGRGLSTGTELEYSDKDTLKNAFENRQ